MAYTNQSYVENFLGRSLTASEVSIFGLIQSSVDNFINDELGGAYGVVTESTKYYDGGTAILDIDPCIAITKVALVDSEEAEDYEYELNIDFELRPRNETTKKWVDSRIGKFRSGIGNIAVTAKFTLGETTPDDIIYLATYMAGKYLGKAVTGELKRESIEGYSREWKEYKMFDEFVSATLNKYIKDDVVI